MGMERKLAAILSTDVQGYSRLMGEDEVATIHTLTAYRELMTSLIQQELRVRNAELLPHRRMEFRIGINLGDVIAEGERLYGDMVRRSSCANCSRR
jgi:adenylate cyclase